MVNVQNNNSVGSIYHRMLLTFGMVSTLFLTVVVTALFSDSLENPTVYSYPELQVQHVSALLKPK